MKIKKGFIGGKIPPLEELQKIEEAKKKLNTQLVEMQTKFENEIVDGVIQCSVKMGYSINKEVLLDMLRRNTPKMVDDSYICPNCGFSLTGDPFCRECGQKLDWTEYDRAFEERVRIGEQKKSMNFERCGACGELTPLLKFGGDKGYSLYCKKCTCATKYKKDLFELQSDWNEGFVYPEDEEKYWSLISEGVKR